MIHLDTHVVVWIYGEQVSRISAVGRSLLEREPTGISPMVEMELSLLHEIGRLAEPASAVLDRVRAGLDLQVSTVPFVSVVATAVPLVWTRDPFDRLIVATARCEGVRLLTRDRLLRHHAREAVWD